MATVPMHEQANVSRSPSIASNLHVCYVLSMDRDRLYADLVSVSALCVRRIYPTSKITVLTDDESLRNFCCTRHSLSDIASEIRSVGSFQGNPRIRSRFVKTQARNILDGDFLYLDADTVPVAEFGEIFDSEAPIAAALDRNRHNPSGGFPAWVVRDFDRLGWRYPTSCYLNGGVVFWKDCIRARALGRFWHDNWLRYATTLENPADQPSLNYSIGALGVGARIMDDAFNARVGLSPKTTQRIRIYHFYIEGDEKPAGTMIDELLATYRENGLVDFALIDNAARSGHPWIDKSAEKLSR